MIFVKSKLIYACKIIQSFVLFNRSTDRICRNLKNVNPVNSLRFISQNTNAEVAELVDALELKSNGLNCPCRFDSGLRHLVFFRYVKILQIITEQFYVTFIKTT